MTGEGFLPTRLTPWLWVGRAADGHDMTWLQKAGIERVYVINCLDAGHAPRPRSLRPLRSHPPVEIVDYVALNSQDTLQFPLFTAPLLADQGTRSPKQARETLWECVQRMMARAHSEYYSDHKAFAKKTAAFIYCAAGLNRSATLAAAYVALYGGHPLATVAAALKSARPGALSNPAFVQQLVRVVLGLDPDLGCAQEVVISPKVLATGRRNAGGGPMFVRRSS
jgi:hypothetical protein